LDGAICSSTTPPAGTSLSAAAWEKRKAQDDVLQRCKPLAPCT